MNETTDATAILAPIWKRKWLILAVGIVVAVASYGYYKRQPSLYAATTQLYLGGSTEEQGLLGESESAKAASAGVTEQAAIINSNILHEAIHQQLRKEAKPALAAAAQHGKVKAKVTEKSEFITITAEAHNGRAAALLANATAQAYINRQHVNYQRAVKAAIAITHKQLGRIETAQRVSASAPKGKGKSASGGSTTVTLQIATLNTKVNRLEADLAVTGVQQVTPAKATSAALLSPHPKKNAIFGFVVGIVLAAAAAFALGRFDRRLRSLTNMEAIFQTQILTALPAVKQPISHRDGPPAPARSMREPLRRLHTTLQLGDILEHDRDLSPRTILFLSADAGDGRSTVVANLALIQADAGERVALIEADFRRPVQAKLLDVSGSEGLADVLARTVALGDAVQSVTLGEQAASVDSAGSDGHGVNTVVETSTEGSVSVLVGSREVANPPALLARETMSDLLASLREDFDHILIDAPPPLEVSDVMPLLHVVDGIVIVARVGHTRDISAQRLAQLLARASSAPVLGIVANSVAPKEIERYGFSSVQPARGQRRKLIRR